MASQRLFSATLMVRVDLARMMDELGTFRGSRVNIQEVHEATGIHRKILSRILNHPEQPNSSEHIEKLVEFFFLGFRDAIKEKQRADQKEYKKRQGIKDEIDLDAPIVPTFFRMHRPSGQPIPVEDIPGGSEAVLMRWVASELLQFFPSDPAYLGPIKKQMRDDPHKVDTNILWSLYQASKR